MIELESRAAFDAFPSSHGPAAVQGLNLSDLPLTGFPPSLTGGLFLGCTFGSQAIAGELVRRGALVLPALTQFAFDVHRSGLYTPEELFAGFSIDDPQGFLNTWDYRIYAEYLDHNREASRSILTTFARRMHDHSITDALHEIVEGRKVVAIMGGHSMPRGAPFYREVAFLSRTLTQRGFLMISGGGPGAMEATHVGAWFATRPAKDLDEALRILAVRPEGATGGEYADSDWLHRAFAVRERFPIPTGDAAQCMSVGVPTWLYGHEPPAPFATHIAKYFANAVREDGLLELASHGVVFAPGSAGTTQEIFQDAAQNHYTTTGGYAPMILFGVDHWTRVRPVWPLLKTVSAEKPYGALVALTDDPKEILRRLEDFEPDKHRR